jgi:APA family basic amino acid/polyamine antiporter
MESDARAAFKASGAAAPANALHRAIGRSGFFTLAFGAIVGSGWVIVLGEWLKAAGPAGVVCGFVLGSLVTVLIALCYGELAARFSTAGGEFLYVLQSFGRFPGFLTGWFLTLYGVSVCAFEAVAFAWTLRALLPAIALGTAYRLGTSLVTWDALLIGLVGAVAIGALHWCGPRTVVRFQNVVTFGFILVMAVAIVSGLSLGSLENLQPLFVRGSRDEQVAGVMWVFSTCAFFLNGWQAALHAIEERKSDVAVRTTLLFIAAAIVCAGVFYCGITLAAAETAPWTTLVNADLPAVAAFRSSAKASVLGTVLLLAAVISLSKTWSAVAWIASRVMVAQAREGFLPSVIARVDAESGAPRAALVVVTLLTCMGVLIGRGAILPIVDMVSISLALSTVLCILALLRRRSLDKTTPTFSVPGGSVTICVALAGASLMVGAAVLEPFWRGNGAIPVEWFWLAGWGALGLALWTTLRRRTGV